MRRRQPFRQYLEQVQVLAQRRGIRVDPQDGLWRRIWRRCRFVHHAVRLFLRQSAERTPMHSATLNVAADPAAPGPAIRSIPMSELGLGPAEIRARCVTGHVRGSGKVPGYVACGAILRHPRQAGQWVIVEARGLYWLVPLLDSWTGRERSPRNLTDYGDGPEAGLCVQVPGRNSRRWIGKISQGWLIEVTPWDTAGHEN